MSAYISRYEGKQIDDTIGILLGKISDSMTGIVKRNGDGTFIAATWDDIDNIDNKPTTLEGYGITDATINQGIITLGSNEITPITNVAYTNKIITKTVGGQPSTIVSVATLKEDLNYTPQDIGAIPTSAKGVTIAELENGKLKTTQKPTYTPIEIGAIAASEKGANNGVATLSNDGKIPNSQLPSYVDDVLEFATFNDFPSTGETSKIYVALDTNLTYRWSGSEYIEISASLALGETSSTAYRGDRGAIAYAHAYTNKGSAFSHGLYKITTNNEGHVIDAIAVTKNDITALGIPAQDTTYENKAAVSGGVDVSLVTTGEKYTWGQKQDQLISGTNIKTINNTSLLGNGNISVGGDIEDVTVNGVSVVSNKIAAIDISDKLNKTGEAVDGFFLSAYQSGIQLLDSSTAGNGIGIMSRYGITRMISNYAALTLDGTTDTIYLDDGNDNPLFISGVRSPVNISDAVNKDYADTLASSKQETLVSGTNIKTINNQSILGSGNIDIQGGGSSYTAGIGIDITSDVISAKANALSQAGIVAAPSASDGLKVWGTDSSGNPSWRAREDVILEMTMDQIDTHCLHIEFTGSLAAAEIQDF